MEDLKAKTVKVSKCPKVKVSNKSKIQSLNS